MMEKLQVNVGKLVISTSGKQLCSKLSGKDFWIVLVESVEDCLDRCKKHEHCQKANYYNYDKSPPHQGRCLMYPIGAEQCNGDSHELRTGIQIYCSNKQCQYKH